MPSVRALAGMGRAALQRSFRRDENTHGFIGIVELDPDFAIVAMPDHVVAIIEVTGTDYRYAPVDRATAILNAWRDALSAMDCSVQILIHRRPINWSLPGGYLDAMERQMRKAAAGARPEDAAWMERRIEQHTQAVLDGEWDRKTPNQIGVADLRQYMTIRHASGRTENNVKEGEIPMYLPPRRGIRALVTSYTTVFGGGREGLAAWRRRREQEAALLAEEVNRFMRDISRIPRLEARRLNGLEVAQLLHLLMQDEGAYADWIDNQSDLNEVLRPSPAVLDASARPVITPRNA